MTKKPKKSNPLINKFLKKALEFGAYSAKIISPKNVTTASWVRWKCQFGCSGYNSSLVWLHAV